MRKLTSWASGSSIIDSRPSRSRSCTPCEFQLWLPFGPEVRSVSWAERPFAPRSRNHCRCGAVAYPARMTSFQPATTLPTLRFGHSPDADDAYMFYGFHTGQAEIEGC